MAAIKHEEAIDPTVRLYRLERFSSSIMFSHSSSSLSLSSESEPFSCHDVIASVALVFTWSRYDLARSGNRQASFFDAFTISATACEKHQERLQCILNKKNNDV